MKVFEARQADLNARMEKLRNKMAEPVVPSSSSDEEAKEEAGSD